MRGLLIDRPLVAGMRGPRDLDPGGAVWVLGDTIQAVGEEARVAAGKAERDGIQVEREDGAGLWLLPGFVQAHIHLCQTLLGGGPDDLSLLPWLQAHVWPGEAAHDAETMEISARLGLAELLSGGATAILDMGTLRHTDSVFRAAAALGARVTSGNALMDDPLTNPPFLLASSDEGLAETGRLAARWHGAENGRLRVAFCPRFAVSCTDGLLREVGRRSRSDGLLVHTHASENLDEIELVRRRTGRANVAYLDEVGLGGPHVVLAHAIHTSEGERDLLASRGTKVAHCPSSNMKLGSGSCPVPEYLRRGIPVGLGADGAPCNDRLDPFTEMRLAALIQKPRLGPAALPAWEVVRMATLGGAEALGLEREIGTIEAGKKADLVLLDPSSGFALPGAWRDDPWGPIVYSFDRSHVVGTWVDGVLRYHRERLPRRALRPARQDVERAIARLKERRPETDSGRDRGGER